MFYIFQYRQFIISIYLYYVVCGLLCFVFNIWLHAAHFCLFRTDVVQQILYIDRRQFIETSQNSFVSHQAVLCYFYWFFSSMRTIDQKKKCSLKETNHLAFTTRGRRPYTLYIQTKNHNRQQLHRLRTMCSIKHCVYKAMYSKVSKEIWWATPRLNFYDFLNDSN